MSTILPGDLCDTDDLTYGYFGPVVLGANLPKLTPTTVLCPDGCHLNFVVRDEANGVDYHESSIPVAVAEEHGLRPNLDNPQVTIARLAVLN